MQCSIVRNQYVSTYAYYNIVITNVSQLLGNTCSVVYNVQGVVTLSVVTKTSFITKYVNVHEDGNHCMNGLVILPINCAAEDL
jgi:hypothetical protein